MRCPKCGFEQAEGGLECLRCGVIFSRFRQPVEVRPETAPPAPPASPSPPIPPIPPAPSGNGGDAHPEDAVPPISLAGAGREILRVFFTFGPRLLLVTMLLDLLVAPGPSGQEVSSEPGGARPGERSEPAGDPAGAGGRAARRLPLSLHAGSPQCLRPDRDLPAGRAAGPLRRRYQGQRSLRSPGQALGDQRGPGGGAHGSQQRGGETVLLPG
jgi:hypothetical protein